MGLNAGDWVKLIKGLLPPGPATAAERGTVFDGMAQALADELVRIDGRTEDLKAEIDPRTTFELLPDFERMLGLPDPCVTDAQTIDQRRNAVIVKLTQLGGLNPEFYIDVAAQLGYAVTITEFKPARCGVSHCGDRLNGKDWAYTWRVNSENNTIRVARVGSAVAGDLLRDWSNQQLECAIEERQPSHGILQFSYGHDGIKYDLSNTAGGGKVTIRVPGQAAVTGTLSTLFTFLRSTTATYLDADGIIKSAGINTPRIEYDYTGAILGLAVEASRTNMALQSEGFPSPWGGTGVATVNANAATAPDGTNAAANIVEASGGTFHYMAQNITIVNATTYCASVFVKKKERTFAQIQLGGVGFGNQAVNINLDTGALTFANGGAGGARQYPNGWWRIWVYGTSTGTAGAPLVLISNAGAASYAGDGVSGIYAWGAQFEVGRKPSSYIKTAGVTVTRDGDVCYRALGGEFSQYAGTVVMEATQSLGVDDTGPQFAWNFDDTTGTERIGLLRVATSSNQSFRVMDGSVFQATIDTTTLADGAGFHIECAWAANDFALSLNGAAALTDNAGTLPTCTTLGLGIGTPAGANQLNGYIKKFDYYPTRKAIPLAA